MPSEPTRTVPQAPTKPAPDPLAAERKHLARARADLHRMRERTLALEAVSGNAVSDAYLARTLHRRAQSLIDDPKTPPFFGRLDMTSDERWYIGRRHIHDEAGDPVVVDWRAEVSRPFYRATHAEPMDVAMRRRFGFEAGALTAYEDEHLSDRTERDTRSRIVAREIERPRTGPMRDIVATIQPDQDDLVRADVSRTICVQGAPGTGKTVVGLHRAAFLLYAHRDRLRRGVLVVGPNRSFLEYVGGVLPALGEIDARHTTVEEMVARIPVRAIDPPEVATLKGDARLAEVIRSAIWSNVATPAEPLIVPRGSRRWRVPADVAAEAIDELRTREDVRYGAARALLSQRLAHLVLVQMEAAGESPDDRVQDAVARSRPVKSYVDRAWPAVDPVKIVLALLSDRDRLAAACNGLLSPIEIESLVWPATPRGPASARWSAADAVLVDEAFDVIERTTSLGHVVLDEAQDLSPMQLRAVGRRCATGSATVLGDLAQGTTPWATTSWRTTLEQLGKGHAEVTELVQGYRVPSQIIEFASRLLPHIAPQLNAPTSIREDPGALHVRHARDLLPAALATVRGSLRLEGSIGIIAADARSEAISRALSDAGIDHHVLGRDEHTELDRLVVVPATLAKGLEYDHVIVLEPGEIVAGEPSDQVGLRRLYVALTRAVSGLTVVHSMPLPATLDRQGRRTPRPATAPPFSRVPNDELAAESPSEATG